MAAKPEKASWNDSETTALIDYLVEHKAEAGDGASFKDATFKAAAAAIAPFHTAGPQKTAKMCKTKWASIKTIYHAIESYKGSSGMQWDSALGANVDSELGAKVWEAFVAVKNRAILKPFRNNGWAHYDKVQGLMPSTARGSYAFHPATAPLSAPIPPNTAPIPPGAPLIPPDAANTSDVSLNTGTQENDGVASDVAETSSIGGKRKYSALVGGGGIHDMGSLRSAMISTTSFGSSDRRSQVGSFSSTKVSRASGKPSQASGNAGLKHSIDEFTTAFNKSLDPDPSAPHERKSRAKKLLLARDDGITMDEKLSILRSFTSDIDLCDTYLDLDEYAEMRQHWLRDLLNSDCS